MQSFELVCWGHPNVSATHKTTWELTKGNHLTPKGDCIIGVRASSSPLELPRVLKHHIQSGGILKITMEVGGYIYSGTAMGHPQLQLTHPEEMVFRTSDFISDRTVGINCSFAAKDIPRKIIDLMKDPTTQMIVRIAWRPLNVSR